MKAFTKISLAMASGLMMAAAWPTRGFTPLIFIAFIPLLYLQDISGDPDNKKRQHFSTIVSCLFYMEHSDYILGMEQHCCRCNSHVDTEQHFYGNSILGLSLCQEKTLWKQKGYFMLPVFFVAFEYLHLNWQLNWPWLNISNVFSHQHTWIQWYEYTGSAGGTIWVLASNIIIYKLFKAAFIDKTDKKVL